MIFCFFKAEMATLLTFYSCEHDWATTIIFFKKTVFNIILALMLKCKNSTFHKSWQSLPEGNHESFSFFSRSITLVTWSCCLFASSLSFSINWLHRSFSFFFLLCGCKQKRNWQLLKKFSSLLHLICLSPFYI